MLIDDIPPKNHLDLANLHNSLGEILKANGSYHHALTQFEMAENIYLKSVPNTHLYLSPTYTNIGNIYRLKKKYRQALEYHLNALNSREKSLPSNHIEIGQSMMEVGLTYHYLGLNNEAIFMLNRAKQIYELNQISENDLRFIEIEEAFSLCQDN